MLKVMRIFSLLCLGAFGFFCIGINFLFDGCGVILLFLFLDDREENLELLITLGLMLIL